MASKQVNLKIEKRGKPIRKLPTELSVYLQGSPSELYTRLAASTGYSPHRLRITNSEGGALVPNDKSVALSSLGLKDGSSIQVKDLGPQIAWRTVFLIEYLGPLLIHPIFYYLRGFIYTNGLDEPSYLQSLSCILIVLHFVKRELETLFVHRFSNATMPAFNIFKNSAHYWALSGFLIAYFIYSPTSPTAAPSIPALTYTGLAFYTFGELANLNTHIILRNLRSPGGTERGVPKGLGFNWVTCPNYLFESIAWFGILLVTRSWATAVFLVVAAGQMAVWAKKKEYRYRKEGGGKYKKKRFAMIPGIW